MTAVLLLAARGVPAQEDEDLEVELFFTPTETVTSVTRHTLTLPESPSAVTLLTREDIEASGARTLPELLRQVPNMDIYMFTPYWYAVGVRGATTEASDKVVLLVDGHEMTVEMLGASVWNMQHFSLDEVERVEVIRGPGSALYGANAYSGVVNVTTRKPGEGKRASLSMRGGEHGAGELALRATERFDKVALALSAGLQRDDLVSVQNTSGREVLYGRLTGTIDLGDDDRILVESGILGAHGDGFLVRRYELHDVSHLFVRAQVDCQNLTFKTNYDYGAIQSELDLQMYVEELKQTIARIPHIVTDLHKFGAYVQHFFELYHNRVTYGAEYFLDRYLTNVTIPREIHSHRLGFFLQDELKLGDLLRDMAKINHLAMTLTGGLRVDYNDITGMAFSPRASLVYNPSANHGFRVGFARAFRKPTFMQTSARLELEDLTGNEILTELDMTNPDLINQTISSLELGYHGDFLKGMLQVRLDLAYNWYRDDIMFVGDPSQMRYRYIAGIWIPDIRDPWFGYENETEGYDGHNLELTLVARPARDVRLFAVAGYRQIFGNLTNRFSVTEPVWNLAAGAELRKQKGLSASLHAHYTSPHFRKITDPRSVVKPFIEVRVPATWLIKARVAWSLRLGPVNLSAGVEAFNLLGDRFRELAGLSMPNGPDFAAERHDRRLVFFLHGQL